MPAQDLTALTLRAAADLVRSRRVSPVELTEACLGRIQQLNPALNAFITVTATSALGAARNAEAEISAGHYRGPLHGIPIAVKDLIDVAGVKTTAGSNVFRERVAGEDAEVVRRLKGVGAVLIGKTNLHEFAYGGSSVISAFGPVRNPLDPERTTGGSSGGSAAAVAACMCYAALGTDTAGSIRLPAAYCGVVGLKPTFGLVSVRGVVPLAWSFDHVGPIARTVEDAALVLAAIAGYDAAEVQSHSYPESCAALAKYVGTLQTTESAGARPESSFRHLRLGIVRDYFFDLLDAEVAKTLEKGIGVLRSLTASAAEVTIPVDSDRTVSNAEQWAYHAELIARYADLYQPETLRRLRGSSSVSAADYIQGRRRLDLLRREAENLFREVDVLATPTVPVPPATIAELTASPDELRAKELLMLRNTRPFNVLGLPAISVPCGATRSGVPVGMQLATAPGAEATLLAFAAAFANAMLR